MEIRLRSDMEPDPNLKHLGPLIGSEYAYLMPDLFTLQIQQKLPPLGVSISPKLAPHKV